jgi:proline dehydrogenase
MHILNRLVVAAIPAIPRPMVRYFAGRYIAGDSLDDAVACVQTLNTEGVCATMDVLGEDITTQDEAVAARDQSISVLHAISREKIDSNLSIKLTSLGLKLDPSFCRENVREILKIAAQYGIFVRFDMEDHTCTSDTIAIFRSLRREFAQIGIVLQAYLRRTEEDALVMIAEHANFRLCKGIYRESPEVAYQKREEIRNNYIKVLGQMLRGGSYVGIATHDTMLIDAACELIRDVNLRKDQYEFQMLLGVRPELRRKLVAAGHKVRLYIPFGRSWYGYSLRRFKENPEIAGYVFRALFKVNR